MTPPQGPASRELRRVPLATLVVTTAGLVLALALVTASLLFASYKDTLNAQKTSLRNVAIAFAAQTMSVAKAVDGTLTRAAGIHRNLGAADVGQVLLGESSGGALEYLRRLVIVDAAGRVLSSVSPEGIGVSHLPLLPALPPLPLLSALSRPPGNGNGDGVRIFVSDVDRRTGAGLINFVRPLARGGDGAPGGWIVAQVDSERFGRLYSLVELGKGGSVTLFQRDGTMLVRGPGYPSGIGRSFLDTPLFREHLPRAERGVFETASPLDGTPRLYGYDTVPGFPLLIITGMNRSDALAPWYGRLWMALAFNVLLAAVLSLLAWRVARGAQRQFQLIELLSGSEARLGKSSDYLASILNAVGAPIWVLDRQLRIVMANHAFARLVGRPNSELIGLDEGAVFSTQDKDRARRYRDLLDNGASVETVGPMQGAGGETRTVIQLTTRLVAESGEAQLVSVLTDITERERAEARLAWLGEFDGVTSLPNQTQFWRLLEARLAAAAVSGRAQAVLALSLERLHEIVDLLGHDAGDRALRQIGDLLRKLAEDGAAQGVVVARIRGAEFGLLVDAGSGRGAVERFAALLHERCSAPLLLDGREFFLAPALGVALFPQDGSNPDDLYRCAQGARSGQGVELAVGPGDAVHFFSARVHLDLDQRLTLEAQLRRALAGRELRLVFQPKATVHGGQVVGFEALLRWSNPLLGDVSPVQFIPIAERTGLIVPIGDWVLEEACRLIGEWSRAFAQRVKVAVNLSPRQFYQKSLLVTIKRCLDVYGVPPGCLEIEITETALMSREEEVDRLMHDIRALGVELSIDDFGTGYSSLAYLKRFPVASLKVDRAFVRDLGKDADSAAIARSIVNLAHGLKLKVVAEGVETQAQLAILREMDCDEYQGFLFSRPVEQDAVPELLRRPAPAGAPLRLEAGGKAGKAQDRKPGREP